MFLDKYLNSTYLDLVYNNYDENYLKLLDENNFSKVYSILKNNGFYFINDIILKYIELFEIEDEYVEKALLDIKSVLGNDYVRIIGSNMTIIDEIIKRADHYSEL